MNVGAVEGIFFAVVFGFVAWQFWSLRDRD